MPRTEGFRLIGKGVSAVAQGWITETITAQPGRGRVALRHAVKAAARHMAGDIGAAKLACVCSRQVYRTESDRRDQSRSGPAC